MRETLAQPGTLRYIVVLLVGMPVALIVSSLHPDRQGAGFVPFAVTLVAALAVVWLLGVLIERVWLGRADARSDRSRRR